MRRGWASNPACLSLPLSQCQGRIGRGDAYAAESDVFDKIMGGQIDGFEDKKPNTQIGFEDKKPNTQIDTVPCK